MVGYPPVVFSVIQAHLRDTLFAAYRAIIVEFAIKQARKSFSGTIATSIARNKSIAAGPPKERDDALQARVHQAHHKNILPNVSWLADIYPAAKRVRQKEFGKKVTKKVTEASERCPKSGRKSPPNEKLECLNGGLRDGGSKQIQGCLRKKAFSWVFRISQVLFGSSGKGRKRQKKGDKGRYRPISRKGGQTPLKPPFVRPHLRMPKESDRTPFAGLVLKLRHPEVCLEGCHAEPWHDGAIRGQLFAIRSLHGLLKFWVDDLDPLFGTLRPETALGNQIFVVVLAGRLEK